MFTFDITRHTPQFILEDQDGYAVAKAIEAGMQAMNDAIEAGVKCITDIDSMPEWRLDEMAWEYNCLYDYHADIAEKREWIKKAITNYKIYGTPQAIVDFLKGRFGEAYVEENWQYSGDPFHFRVTVSGEWTAANNAWAQKAINTAKSLRSVLDEIRFNGGDSEFKVKIGAAAVGVMIEENCVMF